MNNPKLSFYLLASSDLSDLSDLSALSDNSALSDLSQ